MLTLLFLMTELESIGSKIDRIKKNLDRLSQGNPDHKDYVEINLTKSQRTLKFGRLLGNWGVILPNGNWESLENTPDNIIAEIDDYAQRVVNNLDARQQ